MNIAGLTAKDIATAWNLFKITLRDRYSGSSIGFVWSLLNPLLLMGVYIFVFGFVVPARLPGAENSMAYILWLISGYAPWMGISDGIVNGTNSVTSNASLIKNIVLKSELLPIAHTLIGIIPMLIGLFLLIILLLVSGTGLSAWLLLLTVIIPLQLFFLMGINFFLSTVTVFVRDISFIISFVLTLLVFFTPIFYSIDAMPAVIQKITLFNPFYHIADMFRNIIVFQKPPQLFGVIYLFLLTLCLWFFGLRFFRKLKGYFCSFL